MPTTSNFGWTTPADTDLVKDGAAAIRTLGNGIDTSFLDLKGGTTNQVLAKNSNTDLDFKWVADATGIPATIFDAKGDIIAATAADTADRLAVGANDTVLTADSSTATGLKWATVSAGSWTQAATGSLSGATTSISSLTGKAFLLILDGYSSTNDTDLRIGVNNSAAVIQSALDTGKTNTSVTVGAANLAAASLGYTTVFFDLADTSAQAKPIISSYGGIAGARMVNAWTTSAITRIDISTSAGTWDAGTYYVWSFN